MHLQGERYFGCSYLGGGSRCSTKIQDALLRSGKDITDMQWVLWQYETQMISTSRCLRSTCLRPIHWQRNKDLSSGGACHNARKTFGKATFQFFFFPCATMPQCHNYLCHAKQTQCLTFAFPSLTLILTNTDRTGLHCSCR